MQNQDQVLSFSLKPKLPATIVGGVPRRGAIPEIGEAAATLGSLPQVNKPDSELFVTKSEAPRFKNRTPKSSGIPAKQLQDATSVKFRSGIPTKRLQDVSSVKSRSGIHAKRLQDASSFKSRPGIPAKRLQDATSVKSRSEKL
ncbi:hypothetical protein V6N12_068260 [Hibiscus sabdariffa]|uniref:Uncharacterized protein n=1 Tax=Hibiscus sabdariffa TaxID=183260 RepID=A0ABR2FPR3_9ROSI